MNASRRDWFLSFTRSFNQQEKRESVPVPPTSNERIAIIQGRHCLALTSFCSVCVERCPVPGGIRTERGMPMVAADTCTGCGVCHEVCPAPTNAVLLLPRRRLAQTASS